MCINDIYIYIYLYYISADSDVFTKLTCLFLWDSSDRPKSDQEKACRLRHAFGASWAF